MSVYLTGCFRKVFFAAAVALLFHAIPVFGAGPYIAEGGAREGYWTTGDGVILVNGAGECLHTLWWRPEHAVPGCDAAAKAAPVEEPITQMTPPVVVEAEPKPLSTSVYFDFDRFNLDAADETAIADLLFAVSNEGAVLNLEVIGFADRIGSESYNRDLSEKRANAVAAHLTESHGVAVGDIRIEAKGESMPTADCSDDLAWDALLRCLQPDRRVDLKLMRP